MLIVEKIKNRFVKREFHTGVFVDLKNAFDTVTYGTLVDKLNHYGVRGVAKKQFCSDLANRRQFVSLNDQCSSVRKILTGFPQDSVVGLLLFLIYVKDFYRYVKYF